MGSDPSTIKLCQQASGYLEIPQPNLFKKRSKSLSNINSEADTFIEHEQQA